MNDFVISTRQLLFTVPNITIIKFLEQLASLSTPVLKLNGQIPKYKWDAVSNSQAHSYLLNQVFLFKIHRNMEARSIILALISLLLLEYGKGHDVQKRFLIFPPTSLYGTFVAIAVPIDAYDKNVFVSYNFESNYTPVTNITELDEVIFPNLPVISSRQSRSITRELAYTALETKFSAHGMNGRECMLRNICEAAETPLYHNGLIGHLMHIIFTPSSSREEGLDDVYYEAEADGLRGDCDKYLDLCPFSLFDVITRIVEIKH